MEYLIAVLAFLAFVALLVLAMRSSGRAAGKEMREKWNKFAGEIDQKRIRRTMPDLPSLGVDLGFGSPQDHA